MCRSQIKNRYPLSFMDMMKNIDNKKKEMLSEEIMYNKFKKNYCIEMEKQGFSDAKMLVRKLWKSAKGVDKQYLIEKYVHVPELYKDNDCIYRDREGKRLEARVTYVDMSVKPYSYEIMLKNDGRFVTTERDRLLAM